MTIYSARIYRIVDALSAALDAIYLSQITGRPEDEHRATWLTAIALSLARME